MDEAAVEQIKYAEHKTVSTLLCHLFVWFLRDTIKTKDLKCRYHSSFSGY